MPPSPGAGPPGGAAPPPSWTGQVPPAWEEPSAPAHPATAPGPARAAGSVSLAGAVAALAGLLAALAPILPWFRVDVGSPMVEVEVATTGWGSTSMGGSDEVVPTGLQLMWDGWTVGAVPDGVIATVLGVLIAVLGARTALGAGRPGPLRPAVTTILGIAGLLWMAASWRSAQRLLTGYEEMFTRFGAGPGGGAVLVDDLFSLGFGTGFLLCALAFATAALAGFASLWRATGTSPAAVSALPGASPASPLPPGPTPPPPPAGWA